MTTRLPELAAIVPAAGSGERLAIGKSKLLLPLAGEPIITHSLRTLELSPRVGEIIVVVGPRAKSITTAIAKSGFRKAKVLAVGGKSRQESVFNGLLQLNPAFKFILIHDGARPFLSPELLNLCIEGGLSFGAAAAAIPVTDTIKRAGDRGLVVETLDRSRLWQVQTPQVFRRELILEAHRQAQEAGNNSSTDDASLVERLGVPVKLVIGDPINIKITRQADLLFAEALAAQRSPQQVVRSEDKHARGARLPSGYPPDLHTGFGYDVHPLGKGRRLVLGGVRINHPLGLLGHSDGDVVTHAICDALLGAASLGDIGQHFPDKDEKYRGISSLVLLRDVAQKLAERGYYVKNIDVTVVAEEPKLASFRSQMEAKLARAVQVPVECVNVKATTTEGLGFAGRGEGIACYATALIYKKSV